jgi:hypothetical protein
MKSREKGTQQEERAVSLGICLTQKRKEHYVNLEREPGGNFFEELLIS